MTAQVFRSADVSTTEAVKIALANALKETFFRIPGKQSADRLFQLNAIYTDFPTSEDPFDPPCMGMSDISSATEDFDPELLEDSFDEDEELALEAWEASGKIQVSFWGADPLERAALNIGFVGMFGLYLELPMPKEGYPPFAQTKEQNVKIRLTMNGLPQDVDGGFSASKGEWRSDVTLEWEAHVLYAQDAEKLQRVIFRGGLVTPEDVEAGNSS